MKAWAAGAAVAVAAALGAPAAGGEAQDRIFQTGLLKEVAAGQSLVFERTRSGSLARGAVPEIEDGALEVAVVEEDGARAARIELTSGDQAVGRSVLPADGGHPALLVFLESSANAMAELTGGSPFYIRNRIREALGADVALERVDFRIDGAEVPGEAVTFRPFEGDPNWTKMGPFAELTLRVVLSDRVPGGVAELAAVAGPDPAGEPAYADTFTYTGLEED